MGQTTSIHLFVPLGENIVSLCLRYLFTPTYIDIKRQEKGGKHTRMVLEIAAIKIKLHQVFLATSLLVRKQVFSFMLIHLVLSNWCIVTASFNDFVFDVAYFISSNDIR